MTKIAVIIVAAGIGSRAGAGLPKTYRMYNNAPVLRHTIQAFLAHKDIQTIQVVINTEHQNLYEAAVLGLDLPDPAFGGSTRAQSVMSGMKALDSIAPDYVLIHDGARPFVPTDVINRVIGALHNAHAAIPALPISDALWKVEDGILKQSVARDNLVRAQTPQGFHYDTYAKIAGNFPDALDDAQVAHLAGLDVTWVDGDAQNVKLTFPEDFEAQT